MNGDQVQALAHSCTSAIALIDDSLQRVISSRPLYAIFPAGCLEPVWELRCIWAEMLAELGKPDLSLDVVESLFEAVTDGGRHGACRAVSLYLWRLKQAERYAAS